MIPRQEAPRIRVVGRMAPTRSIEHDALLAARGDANILIVGERGPVKAAVARFIHEQSDRSSRAFAVLKCNRLSDELIRAELFGHVEAGLLVADSYGTVFLDEVGALGAATQARLLCHINAAERTQTRVRLIASSSANLKAQVGAGLFLPDLFDRLSAVTLVVPTQRERHDNAGNRDAPATRGVI
jgi:DNA-binding NtrC family response regulator